MTGIETQWPEHEKLHAVADKSQAIGEFLDWLSAQGVHRKVWRDDLTDWRLCPGGTGYRWSFENPAEDDHSKCQKCGGRGYIKVTGIEGWMNDSRSVDDLLAEYFGIDQKRLEEEKRAMLTELRANTQKWCKEADLHLPEERQ